MRLLLATGNAHKIEEITELLRDVPHLELLSLRAFPDLELPEETGTTMRENAILKAAYCARQTGLPCLADDSGIEVDALDGAPGVRSARWMEGSDKERTQALLDKLNDVPDTERGTRYRCAICLAWPSGEDLGHEEEPSYETVEAICEGRIAHEFRGNHGFGYDPVFEITPATGASVEWVGKTMAEAPATVKGRVSHRARALQLIKPLLNRVPNIEK